MIIQDGDAPLHIAVRGNLGHIINILVKHGADLAVQDKVSIIIVQPIAKIFKGYNFVTLPVIKIKNSL